MLFCNWRSFWEAGPDQGIQSAQAYREMHFSQVISADLCLLIQRHSLHSPHHVQSDVQSRQHKPTLTLCPGTSAVKQIALMCKFVSLTLTWQRWPLPRSQLQCHETCVASEQEQWTRPRLHLVGHAQLNHHGAQEGHKTSCSMQTELPITSCHSDPLA